MSTASVREASDIVLLQFERPASKDAQATQIKRAGYGQTYYNQFAAMVTEKGDEGVMKYTSANPPMQCFLRQSVWYKSVGTVPVRGVLFHSTGANNPNLKRYVQPDDNAPNREELLSLLGINRNHNDWNHISRKAGVHAFIGKLSNGEITTIQTGEWNKKAWGCGPGKYGSCNNGWIQFEISSIVSA